MSNWRILRKLAAVTTPAPAPSTNVFDNTDQKQVVRQPAEPAYDPRVATNRNKPAIDIDKFENWNKDRQQEVARATFDWTTIPNIVADAFKGGTPSVLYYPADPVAAVTGGITGAGANIAGQYLWGDSAKTDLTGLGAGWSGLVLGSKLGGKYLPAAYGKYVSKWLSRFGHPASTIATSLLNPEVYSGNYRPWAYINQVERNADKGIYPNPRIANYLAVANVLGNQLADTAFTAVGGPLALMFGRGAGAPIIAATAVEGAKWHASPYRDEQDAQLGKGFMRYGPGNMGMNYFQGFKNENAADRAVSRGATYNPNRASQNIPDYQNILYVAPEGGSQHFLDVLNDTLLDNDPTLKTRLNDLYASGDVAGFKKAVTGALKQLYGTDDANEARILHRVMYQSPPANRMLKVPLSETDRATVNKEISDAWHMMTNRQIPVSEFVNLYGNAAGALESGYRPATRHEQARAIKHMVQDMAKRTGLSYPVAALALEANIDPTDIAIQHPEVSSIQSLKMLDRAVRTAKNKGIPFDYEAFQRGHVRQEYADFELARRRIKERGKDRELDNLVRSTKKRSSPGQKLRGVTGLPGVLGTVDDSFGTVY